MSNRIISFRFDDGLWVGTQKAIEILSPHKASFFIVKDWLADYESEILDEFNKGRYHGSIEEWIELSNSGQDIQAHSCTHRNFLELSQEERLEELQGSHDLISKIHDQSILMCYPYNAITNDDLKSLGYKAAGFLTRPSDRPIHFNNFKNIDTYALKSWAVRERNFDSIINDLSYLPDNTWTILSFHSLDGEGFEPWSSSGFKALKEEIIQMNFKIETVTDTVDLYC